MTGRTVALGSGIKQRFTEQLARWPDKAWGAGNGCQHVPKPCAEARRITLRHNSRLHHIGLGRRHAGVRVLVLVADLHVRVLTEDGELLREFTLDPTRDYQPHGRTSRCNDVPGQVSSMSRDITLPGALIAVVLRANVSLRGRRNRWRSASMSDALRAEAQPSSSSHALPWPPMERPRVYGDEARFKANLSQHIGRARALLDQAEGARKLMASVPEGLDSLEAFGIDPSLSDLGRRS